MTENIFLYLGIYLAAVNLLAVVVTAYDKRAARSGSWRVKERTLLLVSVIGGSVAMITTMYVIRHKTKRAGFMIGIPVIIISQAAVFLFILWRLKGGVL